MRPSRLQLRSTSAEFVGGLDLAVHFVDAQAWRRPPGRWSGRRRWPSRCAARPGAAMVEGFLAVARLDWVGRPPANRAGWPSAAMMHDAGSLLCAQGFRLACQGLTDIDAQSCGHQRPIAEGQRAGRPTVPRTPMPAGRFELLGLVEQPARVPGLARTMAVGQRMLAALVKAGRQAQHFVLGDAWHGNRTLKRRPPLGQRAGLVDDEVSTLRRFSIAAASRNSTPEVAPRPVATMMDMGVARPSAQGQAMINTATALMSP